MVSYETKCKSPQGGIVKKEAAIQISNILIDPKQRKQLELELVEGDKKVRFSKKSNQVL
jgi:large subunit ribosomal protein L24